MLRGVVLALVFVATAVAAASVGSMTSAGPLRLNGAQIEAGMLPALQLVIGDDLVTSSVPASIVFHDKSRITLDPNSRMKLEREGTHTVLRVLQGSVSYRLVAGSNLEVVSSDGRSASSSGGILSVRQGSFTPQINGKSDSDSGKHSSPPRKRKPKRSKKCPDDDQDDDDDKECKEK